MIYLQVSYKIEKWTYMYVYELIYIFRIAGFNKAGDT
jgi:hypothetical protein